MSPATLEKPVWVVIEPYTHAVGDAIAKEPEILYARLIEATAIFLSVALHITLLSPLCFG
jgi:hypothetical protein